MEQFIINIPWTMGPCLVWYFTCLDTFANRYLSQTREDAGYTAELVVIRKRANFPLIKS